MAIKGMDESLVHQHFQVWMMGIKTNLHLWVSIFEYRRIPLRVIHQDLIGGFTFIGIPLSTSLMTALRLRFSTLVYLFK